MLSQRQRTHCSKMLHTMLDVLSAMHFTAADWKLVTPTSTIKNCSENCCFPSDHVSSNNNAITTDWGVKKMIGVV